MTNFKVPVIFTAHDRISGPITKMQDKLELFNKSFKRAGQSYLDISRNAAIAGALILAPLGLMARSAVQFEDKMADVGKTTGMAGRELSDFGQQLLVLSRSTRTSLDDLLKIGEVGGQLGVAKNELLSFVNAANKFNVALGGDYSGGAEEAISQVGKIKNLFAETRKMSISDVITRSGSAINELGANGAGTSQNINEFILRIGQLPDSIKPALTATAALGTFFEEVGLSAEIASGGFSNLLLIGSKNITKFAAQMHMTSGAAKQLLATDPTQFALKFATSLNKLKPDQLAKKLHELQIGSQESIKVVGALGSGTERLAALQEMSNKAFSAGSSLQDEYNKKNSTTAAKLAIARNNIQAFSITVGTKLLPVLGKVIDKLTPIIESVMTWIDNNPGLTKTILYLAGGLGMLSFAVSGVTAAIGLYSKAVFLAQKMQWLWNAAFVASPIGWIALAVAGLIALIVIIIKKWDEWGAAVSLFLGPLGLVISAVQSFRKHWDLLKKAFRTDGIVGALKEIGKTLLDVILYPLQQLLSIVGKLPGAMGGFARAGSDRLERLRGWMEIDNKATSKARLENDWEDNSTPFPSRTYPEFNPKTAQNDQLVQTFMNVTQKQQAEITIKDETGKAAVTKNTGIPIKTTPTLGQFAK